MAIISTDLNDKKIISNLSSERIEWIDIAKGIGILLVVLGHSGFSLKIRWWIWSFHMPLFFLLSGLVFSEKKYHNFYQLFKKRNISLLRPYLIFTIMALFFLSFILPDYVYFLKSTVLYGWFSIALWFIPVLYFTDFFYFFLKKNVNENITLFLLIFCSLIGYALSLYKVHFPYKLEVIFTSVSFYGLGNLFFSTIKRFLNFLSNSKILMLTVLFLFVNITFCYFNYVQFDMAINVIGNFFYAYLSACSGIAFVILISYFISDTPVLNKIKYVFNYLGVNTFIILAVHQTLKLYLIFIMQKVHIEGFMSLLLRHLFLWATLFVVIYLINQYAPFIIGRDKRSKNLKHELKEIS